MTKVNRVTVNITPIKIALDHALTRYESTDSLYGTYDSFRIFHGRGHAFDGLNWLCIDCFYPVWVVTFFSYKDEETEQSILDLVIDHLNAFSQISTPLSVLVQRRYLPKSPWQTAYGTLPKEVFAYRKNVKYRLNFEQQNCGFFLDIEPVRQWLENHAKNKKVLNLFSYTCVFSVVGIANGAQSVINFDLSKRSLETGRDNHKINNLPTDTVKFFANDILKSWGKIKRFGRYDIIINDPPSFQKGSFVATKDYKKIVARLDDLLNPQGHALLCLNSPEVTLKTFKQTVKDILTDAGLEQRMHLKHVLLSSTDFKEKEGYSALKVLVYKKCSL